MGINTIISIVMAIALAQPLFAEVHHISIDGGNVSIDDQEKCSDGTNRATMIMMHPVELIGLGCWKADEKFVYVHWYQSIGQTGSTVNIDLTNKYPRPESLTKQVGHASSPDAKTKAQIEYVDQLNDKCRGGSGDDPATMQACDMREKAGEQLKKQGWCWGPDDAIGADKHWIHCPPEAPALKSQTSLIDTESDWRNKKPLYIYADGDQECFKSDNGMLLNPWGNSQQVTESIIDGDDKKSMTLIGTYKNGQISKIHHFINQLDCESHLKSR